MPVTWWTRIPAYPFAKVGASFVVLSWIAWLSVSPDGWSAVANQCAWAPSPPEKKLNDGDALPLSALTPAAAMQHPTASAATISSTLVLFICSPC
jgi:hypothetical protein